LALRPAFESDDLQQLLRQIDDEEPPPLAGNSGIGNQTASVAVVPYDPNTGKYMTPDGRYEQQTNLVPGSAPKSWTDLMPY